MSFDPCFGFGGGATSESKRNIEKAKKLCKAKKYDEAVPYLTSAIMVDPDYLEDVIAMVDPSELEDLKGTIQILEAADASGRAVMKQRLGADCLEDSHHNMGHFWGLWGTRPFMRVLEKLSRSYFEDERYIDSEKTMIEMLRLCNSDNLGRRFILGSILIRNGRYSEALYFAQIWLRASHDDEFRETSDTMAKGGTVFGEPSKEIDLHISKYSPGALLYTAALASFKLFGDCDQSRQYIKDAVKVQPHTLLKILASVPAPSRLCMTARSPNGSEESRDYLWFTQDLWMKPDVWNWANENPDVVNALLQNCNREACTLRETRVAEFKRCSACHLVRYCSAECQKMDWPEHKRPCKEQVARKASLRQY